MKKTIIIVMILYSTVAALSCATFAHYCEGEKCKNAKILIQGANATFSDRAFLFFGEVMIPVVEALDKLGIYSAWNPDSKQLIVYDNNIFIKLMQNDFTITVNGKKNKMKFPAVLYRGEIYAEAGELFDALEIEYTQSSNIIDIKSRETQGEITKIESINYRRHQIMQYGVNIYVPENMTLKNNIFASEFGKSRLEILPKSEWTPVGEEAPAAVNGFSKYMLKSYEKTETYYLHPTMDFVLHFTDMNENIESQIILNINSDINLPITKLEHYYEYADFHNLKMKIDDDIFSNVSAENYLTFNGSIESEGRFEIKVTKDHEKYRHYIDIKDGIFSGTIHLPFGTGKHNISISLIGTDASSKNIMLFSALNTSDFTRRDLVPTVYLDYDNESSKKQIALIENRGTNQKQISENLYRWILQNYSIDSELNTTRKLSKILETPGSISSQEACILYAGLLRSFQIPAKIATKRAMKHFWVEAFLNGEWKNMGIAADLKNKTFLYFYKPNYETNTEYLEY